MWAWGVQHPHLQALLESGVEQSRVTTVRVVTMRASNTWAESANLFRATRSAFLDHARGAAQTGLRAPLSRPCSARVSDKRHRSRTLSYS
jgi:hypothetical protein